MAAENTSTTSEAILPGMPTVTSGDGYVVSGTSPAKAPPPPEKPADKKKTSHDGGFRELVETVVFVVVLVLLLKTFLAEAFVIPTGSMARTLLGYHRDVTCEQCGYRFKVNASNEAEPQKNRGRESVAVAGAPNCAFYNDLTKFEADRKDDP